ncbi:MAG: S24 family peptidase [Planctomycetota bacterium]|nr:S24 family peptidase [Planctomycetota bacterium]
MALNPALTARQFAILKYLDGYRGKRKCAPTVQEIADYFECSKPTALLHLRALERKGAIRRPRYAARTIELLIPSQVIKSVRLAAGTLGKRQFINFVPPVKADHRPAGFESVLERTSAGPLESRSPHESAVSNRRRAEHAGVAAAAGFALQTHPPGGARPGGLAPHMKYERPFISPATVGSRIDRKAVTVQLLGSIAAGKPIEAIETKEPVDLAEMFRLYKECFMLQVKGDSMIGEQIRDGDFVIVEKRATAKNGEMVVALLDNNEATLKRFYAEKGRVRLQPSNPSQPPLYTKNVRVQGVVVGVLRKY